MKCTYCQIYNKRVCKHQPLTDFEVKVLNIRITHYNNLHPRIKPYILKYWQALKEIWKSPIKADISDVDILKKYGLGDWSIQYKNSHQYPKFHWDYDLEQLNKQLKLNI